MLGHLTRTYVPCSIDKFITKICRKFDCFRVKIRIGIPTGIYGKVLGLNLGSKKDKIPKNPEVAQNQRTQKKITTVTDRQAHRNYLTTFTGALQPL
jgi:hypothetical protein